MSILIVLGVALLAVLIWAGRKPARVSGSGRLFATLFAAMAAVAAVVSALRGGWIPSLILVGLSAYLARTARYTTSSPPVRDTSRMSLSEARAILGVREGAARSEIVSAYRRLMHLAHPDHGGSTGLAAQLNAARDRLLRPGGET